MGLVLSRRKDQVVLLEVPGWPTIRVRVAELHRSSCKLDFQAPGGVVVSRGELHDPLPEPGGDCSRPGCPRDGDCPVHGRNRPGQGVPLPPLRLREDRSIEQQTADGDLPNPYAGESDLQGEAYLAAFEQSATRHAQERTLLAYSLRGSQMLWPREDMGAGSWERLPEETREKWLELAERVIYAVDDLRRRR